MSPRISAQHGVFLYSSIGNDKRGSLKIPTRPMKDNLFIAISPQLKKQALGILNESFDIRLQTLFPDIDGFAKANSHNISVNEMWRW